MKKKILQIEHFLLVLGILCIVVGGVVGYQYIHTIRYQHFPRPRQTNVNLIQGWMTLPYVAHTYHISEEQLFVALSIEESQKKVSINTLARKNNKNTTEFLEEVKSTVMNMQEIQHPVLPSPSP